MRVNTTLAWLVGVLLLGSLMGCDRAAETESVSESLVGAVDLQSATALAAEGEVISFKVTKGDGTETVHQYVKKNGELEPVGDAPEMTLPEQHELGAIPVSINGGSAYVHPAAEAREPAEAGNKDWSPNRMESGVPAIEVDRSFRIETNSFVQHLQDQGRNVQAKQFSSTGPSQASELTRLEIDGMVKAELYQFDNPRQLDAWYRVSYQLHESAGHDPDARIEVNGLTMLRLGDNADAGIPQTFLDSPKAALLEK